MDKIKNITLQIQRWQAGIALGIVALVLSYIFAVTTPVQHSSPIVLYHVFGMVVAGGVGTVLICLSLMEMWDKWDA